MWPARDDLLRPDGSEPREPRGPPHDVRVRQHTLFNLGRTASYTVFGAVFGALGGVLFVTTNSVTAAVEPLRGIEQFVDIMDQASYVR